MVIAVMLLLHPCQACGDKEPIPGTMTTLMTAYDFNQMLPFMFSCTCFIHFLFIIILFCLQKQISKSHIRVKIIGCHILCSAWLVSWPIFTKQISEYCLKHCNDFFFLQLFFFIYAIPAWKWAWWRPADFFFFARICLRFDSACWLGKA